MARAHHSGFSSAAVPRLTRAQPVASAAARVVVADTAGQFDRHVEFADDLGQQFAVVAATERRIEIDQVNPLGAVVLPAKAAASRGAVVGLAARLALHEANCFTVGNVDCRQKDQAHCAYSSACRIEPRKRLGGIEPRKTATGPGLIDAGTPVLTQGRPPVHDTWVCRIRCSRPRVPRTGSSHRLGRVRGRGRSASRRGG